MRKLQLLVVLSVLAPGCGGEPPRFVWVRAPADTCDSFGPYRIEVEVFAEAGVYELSASIASDSGFAEPFYFEPVVEARNGGVWALELEGRPAGSEVRFFLKLVDGLRTGGGEIVYHPEAAPAELEGFSVLPAEACGGG